MSDKEISLPSHAICGKFKDCENLIIYIAHYPLLMTTNYISLLKGYISLSFVRKYFLHQFLWSQQKYGILLTPLKLRKSVF